MTTDTYAARVARGAALLDEARPGWAREIAPDAIRMASCNGCILGQLYGEYVAGFRAVLAPQSNRRRFSASAHGFTLPPDEQDASSVDEAMARFAALADAWRDAIRERVGGGKS